MTVLKHIIIAAAAVMLFSCASTQQASDDNYFGYDNSPSYAEETEVDASSVQSQAESKKEWQNPLGSQAKSPSQYSSSTSTQKVVYVHDDYYYRAPLFVPVVTPWWSGYHGYFSYYSPRARFYVYSAPYWSYSWYSPWYDYHPYYGNTWHHHHYYGYQGWYNQPIYTYHRGKVDRERTYRNFGATRGTYTYADRSRHSATSSSRSSTMRTDSRTSGNSSDAVSSSSRDRYSPPTGSTRQAEGSSSRSTKNNDRYQPEADTRARSVDASQPSVPVSTSTSERSSSKRIYVPDNSRSYNPGIDSRMDSPSTGSRETTNSSSGRSSQPNVRTINSQGSSSRDGAEAGPNPVHAGMKSSRSTYEPEARKDNNTNSGRQYSSPSSRSNESSRSTESTRSTTPVYTPPPTKSSSGSTYQSPSSSGSSNRGSAVGNSGSSGRSSGSSSGRSSGSSSSGRSGSKSSSGRSGGR